MAEEKKREKANASEVIGEGMLLGGRIIGVFVLGLFTLITAVVGIACFYYVANYDQYVKDMEKSKAECEARREAEIRAGDPDPEICGDTMSRGVLLVIGILGSICSGICGYGVYKVYTSDRVASLFAVSWLFSSFGR